MVPKACSIPECDRPCKARELCAFHYSKAHKRGDFPRATRDKGALFWAKVDKSGNCWEWTAAKNPKGYGLCRVGGRGWLAHRLSYTMTNGEIPEGLVIDHTCHNRICVNPGHLRLVTGKQNQENRAGAQENSSTGIRGVGWHEETKKWRGFVVDSGKYHHVGLFLTQESAAAAVIALRNELFTHNDLDRKLPK